MDKPDSRPNAAEMIPPGGMERISSPREGGREPRVVLYRHWAAPSPRAALILVHGMGGHSDRYQECGRTWAGRGISLYALELAGFGHTEGLRGHVDSFDVYRHDLEILLARVMAEHSRRPVFLLGESMGGMIAIDFVVRRPALVSGLVLVSPSFKDRLRVPLLTKAGALLHVLARHRKWYDVPWNPAAFTRDPALIEFLNNDPLETHQVTAQFYFAYTPVAARARKAAPLLKLPILMLLPGEDRMIDTDYSRAFFQGIDSRDKRVIEYAGHFHALLLDLDHDKVLSDIADWILERA